MHVNCARDIAEKKIAQRVPPPHAVRRQKRICSGRGYVFGVCDVEGESDRSPPRPTLVRPRFQCCACAHVRWLEPFTKRSQPLRLRSVIAHIVCFLLLAHHLLLLCIYTLSPFFTSITTVMALSNCLLLCLPQWGLPLIIVYLCVSPKCACQ